MAKRARSSRPTDAPILKADMMAQGVPKGPEVSVLSPQPAGLPGLKIYGGRVSEEWHRKLEGPRGYYEYREMLDNDPIIGGTMRIMEFFLRRIPWSMREADSALGGDPGRIVEAAEFAKSCIDDMRTLWTDILSDAFTMYPYGWALLECMMKVRMGDDAGAFVDKRGKTRNLPSSKYSDGRIGWDAFQLRAQETRDQWCLDDNGDIIGMWQWAPPMWERRWIPMDKCVLFRTTCQKNNPEGRSLFRNAFVPYFFKKRIEGFEGIGIERELCGMPDMQVPANILLGDTTEDASVRDSYKDMLSQIRSDNQAFILRPSEVNPDGSPSGYKFQLTSSGGNRKIDTHTVITRHEQRIALTMQSEFMLVGMGSTGGHSTAMHADKSDMFMLGISAFADIIQDTFHKQAMERLMKLNGFEPEVWPTWTHGHLDDPDTMQLANAINLLTGAGHLTPGDKATEEHLREVLDLPQLPVELRDIPAEPMTTQSEAMQDGPPPSTEVPAEPKPVVAIGAPEDDEAQP